MASSKPIESSQVAKPDILAPLKKEARELEADINRLNESLGKTSKALENIVVESAKLSKQTPLDSLENIEKKEKGINEATAALKELEKVEKDRIKLEAQLKTLEEGRIKSSFELKERIIQQTKALKEEAKEVVNSKNAYEQLVDKKKEAQKELLRLTAAFGENTEQVQDAKKVYTDLKKEIEDVNNVLKTEVKEVVQVKNAYEQLTDREKEAKNELLRLSAAHGVNTERVQEAKKAYEEIKKEIEDVNSVLKKDLTAFEQLTESTKKAEKNLKDLGAELGVNSKEATQAKNEYNELKNKLDEVNASTKNLDAFDQLNADLKKAEKNVKSLSVQFDTSSKQVKDAQEVYRGLKEQVKQANDALKETIPLAPYKQLVKNVAEAKEKFNDLLTSVGKNNKRTKEAREEYEKLSEELEKVDENTKKAKNSTSKLGKAFKALAAAAIVLKALELIKDSISKNSEGAASLEKAWVRVTAVIEVFARRVVKLFPVIQAKIERFFLSAKISIKELSGIFTDNGDEIEELQKQYEDLAKLANTDLSLVFAKFGAEVEKLTKLQIALIDKTLLYRRQIIGIEEEVSKLIPKQKELRAGFDDDAKSLKEQVKSGAEYIEITKKRFEEEKKISAKRIILAQDNAKANSQNLEAQEALQAASREQVELISDQVTEIAEAEIKLQKLRNDITELNLDFYVDDAQNRVDVNQRIIDDETQTYKRRKELLLENDQERETANKLRAEALNISLKQMGKAELDFEKLRSMTSSAAIAEEVENAGLSEQLSIRVLEIIRERRTEIQDSADAQRDLNDAEAESRLIQDDILLQREALNSLENEGVDLEQLLITLSEDRLQNEIDNLQERLLVAEDGSQRFLDINQELNDKLLEQNQIGIDKRKEQLEEFKEYSETVSEFAGELSKKLSDRRIASIDEEIAAEQERLSALQTLAAEGNEDAENNLALTEQRQAQLELEKEKEIKKQAQLELQLAAVQTYSAKVAAGEENPLVSTVSDLAVLRAAIDALPAFYEGSERVGDDLNPQLSGRDGHIIRVDGDERILNPTHAAMIPNSMSNFELASMASKTVRPVNSDNRSNTALLLEIQDLKRVTKNKPTYLGSDIDNVSGMITKKIQTGNKLERIHYKTGGIWG